MPRLFVVLAMLFFPTVIMIACHDVQGQSLKISDHKMSYELSQPTPVNLDEGVYAHEIIVYDLSRQLIDRIRWNDHVSSYNSGYIYKDKLVIFGVVGSSGEALSILDLGLKKSVLFALCRTPAHSPSGKYISYLQFIPRNIGNIVDDVLLTIDLDDVPINKSTDAGWVVDSTNVGMALYPAAYIKKTSFYIPIASKDHQHLISVPPVWDSRFDLLVVTSKVAGQLFLVSIDFTRGMAQRTPTQKKLEGRQFLLDKSLDPNLVRQVEENLMISRVSVENGIASLWATDIPNIKLRKVEVLIRPQ